MKISLDWVGDYVDLAAIAPSRIKHDLTLSTVEVEALHDLGGSLADVVVARVESVLAQSGPKELTVVRCDVGGARVEAVCEAANLVEGMLVPLALSSAHIWGRVQATTGEQEQPAELARVAVHDWIASFGPRYAGVSGVVCSARHLSLQDLFPAAQDSAIDLADIVSVPGDRLADVVDWNDAILEIDNKSLTNRPDLWSHYGIARELAAIYRLPLREQPAPDTDWPAEDLVTVDSPECNRLALLRLTGVRMEPAPLWMRSRLARVGQRPLNLWVDLTNYVMFAVGQPCHAYDCAHLSMPLVLHSALADDRIDLLDGGQYRLKAGTLVISDANGLVDLVGIMGGKHSAVSAQTTEILLEAGNFDALAVRRASAALGLRTEASSRFEKALDTPRVDDALALFRSLVQRIQPSVQFAGFQDLQIKSTARSQITVGVGFIQERLGAPIQPDEIVTQLRWLGFDVTKDGLELAVTAPTWRSTGDISLPSDILDEVARLRGYDSFEFVPPEVDLLQPTTRPELRLERSLKTLLAFSGGMQEVVTYPWTRDLLVDALGLTSLPRLRLLVPAGQDQNSLRPSLLPNLLEVVEKNIGLFPSFRVFEFGRVFRDERCPTGPNAESLMAQPRHLAGALVGSDGARLFREAKGLIEAISRTAQTRPLGFRSEPTAAWADLSARLSIVTNGQTIGTLGLLTRKARRMAGIKGRDVVMFELSIDDIEPLPSRENRYVTLPAQPENDFDISLLFRNDVAWQSIATECGSSDVLVRRVSFVDEYRGRGIPDGHKSLTVRLWIGAERKTLTAQEIAAVAGRVVDRLKQTLGAETRP